MAVGVGAGVGATRSGGGGVLALTGIDLLPWVLLALGCVIAGVVLLRTSMLRRGSRG